MKCEHVKLCYVIMYCIIVVTVWLATWWWGILPLCARAATGSQVGAYIGSFMDKLWVSLQLQIRWEFSVTVMCLC